MIILKRFILGLITLTFAVAFSGGYVWMCYRLGNLTDKPAPLFAFGIPLIIVGLYELGKSVE